MLEFEQMRPPSFRTVLMDIEHAARWARCLAANRRFTSVEIQTSRRAKSPEVRYFVTYQPASPKKQAQMLDHQQEARIRRAEEQEFTFCHDGDHDFYHCLSHSSGNVWKTTLNSCNCPDHAFRCLPNQIACKHQIALSLHIRAERTTEFQPIPRRRPITRDMQWVNDQAAFEAVFGP